MHSYDDYADDHSSQMPSKLVVQDVKSKLLSLQVNGRAASKVLASLRKSADSAMAVDMAIAALPIESTRRNIAKLVFGNDDIHAFEALGNTSIVLVCVGCYCNNQTDIDFVKPLKETFSGNYSGIIDGLPADPRKPDTSALIAALDFSDWRATGSLMVATLLQTGNLEVPVGDMLDFPLGTNKESALPMGFVFGLQVEDCDFSKDYRGQFKGTHFESCVSVISGKIRAINEEYPGLNLTALPPMRLSESIQAVQELAVAASTCMTLTDLEKKFVDLLKANDLSVDKHTSMFAYGTATMSLTVWPDESVQTVDIIVQDQVNTASPAITFRTRVSLLSTVDSVYSVLGPALAKIGYESKKTPAQPSPVLWQEDTELQPFRDVDGRWIQRGMEMLPLTSRQLLKSSIWRKYLDAQSMEEYESMAQWPFPFLFKNMDIPSQLQNHFRKDVASEVLRLCAVPGLSHAQAVSQMEKNFPGFDYLDKNDTLDTVHDGWGLPCDIYHAQHFRKCDGHVFHIRKALVERLEISDIEAGVPVGLLRAPFADCYFHLVVPEIIDESIDGVRHEFRWTGCFITQSEVAERPGAWRLAFGIVVTEGFAVSESEGFELELEIAENDPRDLLQAINDSVNARGAPGLTSENVIYKVLSMCAKIILYLDMRSARLVDRKDKTNFLATAQGKPPGERKRIMDQASRMYDFIMVGPEKTMAQEAATSHRGSSKAYWRRGFFRMQAYGPKWSLHRQRWIQPMLVNADKISESEAKPSARDYIVGKPLKH